MKQIHATLLLILSLALSAWLVTSGDNKIEKLLTSKEWQSHSVSLISEDFDLQSYGPLARAEMTANVKYLPNGGYIRAATVRLFSHSDDSVVVMNITESGFWDISDNYLLISPTEFKNVTTPNVTDFTEQQLEILKQIFKMNAQASRRIDIVNEKSLLLTSLNHGSTVLFSH
ncbi:regulatory protein ToxS [Vibrio sp. WXL103]|uniref:regulatory protein ToxS n=1 Tax=unclassified Vibrio TaxID=2614977 RepID=UPI003EC5C610